ncbi:hypothetical protein [Mycobacterium sp. HUMS_1102779]|uniref:hypothetical protein n=1 Tax=Mycobacterium sp. HUMS_1102779 TaxID=3383487 RepID=UPI00389B21BA
MECPSCATSHPDAARFCGRCGTPLHPAIDRSGHYAAHPEGPVRALAVMSTLMPHLAGGRHHIYRTAIAVTLLAALVAAAFGVLSVALVLAAIALPAVVLTYVHDHDVWRREPLTVIGVAVVLSVFLGAGVGLLEGYFTKPVLLAAPEHRLPSLTQILELGVLVPVVAFAAALIAPMSITARPAFRHPVDAVVVCSLSGAALSLGLSLVVQRGAFSHVEATAGDPAHVAFIALTLGFLQPVVFATAAALTGDATLKSAPATDQICAPCGAALAAGAAFCQVCGTATAALARHSAPAPGPAGPAPTA